MVCSLVSMIISVATAEPGELAHAWIEGFAILVAVFVCSSVAAINDY